jgi:hypothetical protein
VSARRLGRHLPDLAPAPDASNPDLGRVRADRDGLKRDFADRLSTAGSAQVTPAMIEKELARIERAVEPPSSPRFETGARLGRVSRNDLYRVYFHDASFRVLQGTEVARGGKALIGTLAPELPALFKMPGARALTAPRLLELCFQTAGVIEIGSARKLGLPSSTEEVRVHDGADDAAPRFAEVGVTREGAALRFDAVVRDEAGAALLGPRAVRKRRNDLLRGRLVAKRLLCALLPGCTPLELSVLPDEPGRRWCGATGVASDGRCRSATPAGSLPRRRWSIRARSGVRCARGCARSRAPCSQWRRWDQGRTRCLGRW